MVTQVSVRPVVTALRVALLAVVAAGAVFLSGAVPTRAATAVDVAVICDPEIAPYRAMLEAFTEACDCTVRVIPPQVSEQPGLELRLKAAGVRAVLAVGLQARAAVEGVRELPVVLTMVPQVASWIDAQPNRHGIGMSLAPRQNLETLRRVFPQAKRIGVVFDPAQTGGYVREAGLAAAALNLTLETHEIGKPGDLSRHLEELRDRIDVIWMLPDPTLLQGENLSVLLLASFESRVPIFSFASKYVALGAIAAAFLDPVALGTQAAEVIGRASSRSGGVAQPRWEYARGAQLVLNQKVARKMGIVLDPAVLEAAADVIR